MIFSDANRNSLYGVLLRHALLRLVFLYFVPLLLLTLVFHVQYRLVVRDAQKRHLVSLAEHQASMMDMFLGDRLRNLADGAGDPDRWVRPDSQTVATCFERLRQASDAFVDLAVLDDDGRVLGYAGPHPWLERRVYAEQDWFRKLVDENLSHIVTDIYRGFRDAPHFTLALKLDAAGSPRILRAVLGPDEIRAHMASLEGAGEVHAFVVDRSGRVQVSSPSARSASRSAPFEPGRVPDGVLPPPAASRTGTGTTEGRGGEALYAWARLGMVPWTLVAVDATGGQGGLVGAGGPFSAIITNIWLVAALFCVLGGVVILMQARWMAREQYAALSKEREMSRQLMQAAKLASVGELAAGVAHEINNPLAVVSEKAGLVKDLLNPEFGREPGREELLAHLDVISKAVYRCTDITRNLLGFVREQDVKLVERDLHALIDDVADGLLGPELETAGIEVVKRYEPELGVIHTDPGQLRQVIFNLLKNARDAVDAGGRITILTRAIGDRFTLEVIDTGHGLTPEQLEKVFMPFFTTKAPDKGTGLGLSVSYRIVKGLGGRLSVSSRPGEGTAFAVDLPRRS